MPYLIDCGNLYRMTARDLRAVVRLVAESKQQDIADYLAEHGTLLGSAIDITDLSAPAAARMAGIDMGRRTGAKA